MRRCCGSDPGWCRETTASASPDCESRPTHATQPGGQPRRRETHPAYTDRARNRCPQPMQPYTGDNPISGHQPYSFSLNLTRSLFPRARGPKLPTCARKSPILPPKLVATPWQPLVHVEGGATPFGGTHVLFVTNRRCAWPETGTLENMPGCQCSCLNPSGNDIAINRAAKPRRRRSRTSLHATAPFCRRRTPAPCPRPPRAAA